MHCKRDQAAAAEQAESVKPAETVQSNEAEWEMDLDEIEEDMEVKQIEELAEEEEKVVEEEAEGKIEQNIAAVGADTRRNADIDLEDCVIEDDEAEKHAKLLALPPHGSVIYVAGLSSDISEEDLSICCKPVGEVTTVRSCVPKSLAIVFKNVCTMVAFGWM